MIAETNTLPPRLQAASVNDTSSRSRCGAREANRLDRREAILAVAANSFLANGYAGTSMSEVAATLGGSKSTLWSYFPSKSALFEAAIDSVTASAHARLSELLEPHEDLQATLTGFVTNFIGILTSPRAIALHRLVLGEAGRFPEVGDIYNRRVLRRTRDRLAEFFLSSMQRGQVRESDPKTAAQTLIALCLGGSYQHLLLGLREEADAQCVAKDVTQALDTFLRAFAPGVQT